MASLSAKERAFRWLHVVPIVFIVLAAASWGGTVVGKRHMRELAVTCDSVEGPKRDQVVAECTEVLSEGARKLGAMKRKSWAYSAMSATCALAVAFLHVRRRREKKLE